MTTCRSTELGRLKPGEDESFPLSSDAASLEIWNETDSPAYVKFDRSIAPTEDDHDAGGPGFAYALIPIPAPAEWARVVSTATAPGQSIIVRTSPAARCGVFPLGDPEA